MREIFKNGLLPGGKNLDGNIILAVITSLLKKENLCQELFRLFTSYKKF